MKVEDEEEDNMVEDEEEDNMVEDEEEDIWNTCGNTVVDRAREHSPRGATTCNNIQQSNG